MTRNPFLKEAFAKQQALSKEEFEAWFESIRDKFSNRAFFSQKERYDLLQRYSWKCALCGTRLQMSKKSRFGYEVAHIDHIHPIAKWFSYKGPGIHSLENIQPLCGSCNRSKSDKVQSHPKQDHQVLE